MRLSLLKPRGLALGLAAMFVLVACGNSTSTSTSTNLAATQKLTFPILGDFGSLDPGVFDAETDSEIAQNIFSGVVKFDDGLNVVCDLCTELPTVSSDGMTYTFKLNASAKFSNGDPVNAAAVIYSWNRAAALGNSYASNFAPVTGFDTVSKNKLAGAQLESALESGTVKLSGLTSTDDHTVVAKLDHPAGYFLQSLALVATGWIVDPKVVKTDPENWWTKPETLIGSGPYKMTARVPKQSVDFASVDNYWGSTKPVIKTIHLDILDSASTAIAAYEQGKYDIYGFGGYSNAPVNDVQRIQGTANEKDQLHLQPKVRSYWLSFNLTCDASRAAKGPFCGPESSSGAAHDLRLAFALAIDKNVVANVVCKNIVCKPLTGGLIVQGLAGAGAPDSDPLAKFDATKAKELLKSADPTGSLTKGLTYTYDPNSPINAPTATNLADQWQTNLGVKVDVQPVDHSAFIKSRLKGAYVMSRDGWQADYNHPQDWYDNLFGTNAGGPDHTTSGFVSKTYDDTLATADAKKLSDAQSDYGKLSKQLEDDAAYIPLYYSVGAFLFKPYVKNAGTNNFFDHYWSEMSILQH
ncbi:MAG: peptide ABC transporter substrate-binding protein [Candidatus Dormibacteria bacterium]